ATPYSLQPAGTPGWQLFPDPKSVRVKGRRRCTPKLSQWLLPDAALLTRQEKAKAPTRVLDEPSAGACRGSRPLPPGPADRLSTPRRCFVTVMTKSFAIGSLACRRIIVRSAYGFAKMYARLGNICPSSV